MSGETNRVVLRSDREDCGEVASSEVDATLPRRIPKHNRTNGEVAAMVGRMVDALAGRGVADQDPEVLSALAELGRQVEDRLGDVVTACRGFPAGLSWQQVADRLGVTRQAAQQRYRKAGGVRRAGGQEARYR